MNLYLSPRPSLKLARESLNLPESPNLILNLNLPPNESVNLNLILNLNPERLPKPESPHPNPKLALDILHQTLSLRGVDADAESPHLHPSQRERERDPRDQSHCTFPVSTMIYFSAIGK